MNDTVATRPVGEVYFSAQVHCARDAAGSDVWTAAERSAIGGNFVRGFKSVCGCVIWMHPDFSALCIHNGKDDCSAAIDGIHGDDVGCFGDGDRGQNKVRSVIGQTRT